jgi:hypothetical protein
LVMTWLACLSVKNFSGFCMNSSLNLIKKNEAENSNFLGLFQDIYSN